MNKAQRLFYLKTSGINIRQAKSISTEIAGSPIYSDHLEDLFGRLQLIMFSITSSSVKNSILDILGIPHNTNLSSLSVYEFKALIAVGRDNGCILN